MARGRAALVMATEHRCWTAGEDSHGVAGCGKHGQGGLRALHPGPFAAPGGDAPPGAQAPSVNPQPPSGDAQPPS